MKKYMKEESSIYNKYVKLSKEFGGNRDFEYLFVRGETRKCDYDYYEYIKEMDINFNGSSGKFRYLDICASPGSYSKFIHKMTKGYGVGLTLDVAKGGLEFKERIGKYKLIYLDIIREDYIGEHKFDFIISGCLNMTLEKMEVYHDVKLWQNSFIIGINNLKYGGTFAFKISSKYLELISNYIYIFLKSFGDVEMFKSSKILPYRSFCYIVGRKYKGIKSDIYETLLNIKNDDAYEQMKWGLLYKNKMHNEEIKGKIEDVLKVQNNAIELLLEQNMDRE